MPHVRKPKLIEERLALHGSFIASNPGALRGSWRQRGPQQACRLRVDLGCGKGVWSVAAAQACPGELLVGIDNEPMCVSFAAEQAALGGCVTSGRGAKPESGYTAPANIVFAIGSALEAGTLFAPGEIDDLHLNFPTPFPKKKQTALRTVGAPALAGYAPLLAPEGTLHLKTDSQPLFDYALEELARADYEVLALTRDLSALKRPDALALGFDACDLLASGYERKLAVRGARIHALAARPRHAKDSNSACATEPCEASVPEMQPKSLYDYLPQDLDELLYVPLGMENAVTNMRNRKRNGH